MDKLPPYALNVFVPLLDIAEDLGPTEFWLASHCTDDARQTFLKEQSALGYEKLLEKKNIIGPLLQAGDALIYDYRICHRGTSNLSKAVRPMLYLLYARPWFKEHLNFGTQRLLATCGNDDQDESE
jgi:ectoine hydroxylase-related dioxygenase (phytanoyl-CoA dioxygenase family)